MGSSGFHHRAEENLELNFNLQLIWIPMGSNGKQLLDQIIIIFNLKLQWTPLGSMVSNKFISLLLSAIYNSNGLQWLAPHCPDYYCPHL